MGLVTGNGKFLHVHYATLTRSLHENRYNSGTLNWRAFCFIITKHNLSGVVETGKLRVESDFSIWVEHLQITECLASKVNESVQ